MSRFFRRAQDAVKRGADAVARVVLWGGQWLSRPLPSALLLLSFVAIFFVTGVEGVDFGVHWDEWYHQQVVASCIQRMSLLPDGLSYGGPYFTLGFPVVVAHQWKDLMAILRDMRTLPSRMDPSAFPSVATFKANATALLNTVPYVLEVRTIFVGLTAFAVLWAFLASLRCTPGRRGVALAGAAFLAFSWELGYHARWIAIDAPLSQFAALELFLFCAAWRSPSEGPAMRWYWGAAAAAGAVFACKLTGMFAFIPILALPLLRRSGWSWQKRLANVAVGTAIFVLVSFALSPAFYLDPLHLLNVFRSGSADYNTTGATYPYYVGVAEHALRMLIWYFWAFPSPYLVVAIVFSGIAFIGLGSLLRRETRMTLSWLLFMVVFIGLFTHNHLLIVRQYLMCTPFLALCFARGTAAIWDFLRNRDRRLAAGFVVVVVAAFAANVAFESTQAWRITRDTPDSIADAAAKDLRAHREPVRISHSVFERLRSRLGSAYVCRPANGRDNRIQHFIGFQIEHEWMSNRLHSFLNVYGSPEVNLAYYSGWFGRSHNFRLVDVPIATVEKLGRNMSPDIDCFPAGTPGITTSQPSAPDRKAQASADYHELFAAANAIDGFASSEWLLPDHSGGWLDVVFNKPHDIHVVRLINGHNRNFNDRAVHEFRLEAYAGDRLLLARDGSFAALDPNAAPLDVPLAAQGVTRVRFVVKTWFGAGSALAEIQIDDDDAHR